MRVDDNLQGPDSLSSVVTVYIRPDDKVSAVPSITSQSCIAAAAAETAPAAGLLQYYDIFIMMHIMIGNLRRYIYILGHERGRRVYYYAVCCTAVYVYIDKYIFDSSGYRRGTYCGYKERNVRVMGTKSLKGIIESGYGNII